jgi:hypothetical protein
MKNIIPRIKGKWEMFTQHKLPKLLPYVELIGLSLCVTMVIILLKNDFKWWYLLSGVAIYYIYEEIRTDLLRLFSSFKRR